MASADETQVMGEFMLPIIDDDIKNSDPWQRNYFVPPPFSNNAVPRSFPLTDVRPLMSQSDYTPTGLLKSHGFGVVKHHSPTLDKLDIESSDAEQTIVEKYHPEIKELVKKTTGAKTVFITASGYRRGQREPTKFAVPGELKRHGPAAAEPGKTTEQDKTSKPAQNVQPSSQSNKAHVGNSVVTQAKPVRMPHMDFTPRGARQAIRLQSEDIRKAASSCGIIDAEDRLCSAQSVKASIKESDSVIADGYNQNGQLGPRYAAYSIWRPLKKVQRDPISLSPRSKDSSKAGDGFVYCPYDNKIPGSEELGGDYLKEYAALGVEQAEDEAGSDRPKWFYVSGQEPDEVIFIKLFDSASLGEKAEHAPAPWHASPEIGSAEGDEPRESIDIRVIAFW